MMFHRSTEKPIAIVEMALSVWAIIHLADAFDQCDVRHKFVPETGKNYFPYHSKFKGTVTPKIHDSLDIKYSNVLYLSILECRNRATDEKCDQWAALGRCVGNTYESMYIQCKRSCGFCSKYYVINDIPNGDILLTFLLG